MIVTTNASKHECKGSMLGPILFILYINDISESLPSDIHVKLYADDLKSYCKINNSHSIDSIRTALDVLSVWVTDWQLHTKSIILPILDYSNCSQVCSPYHKIDITRLEYVQRVFTKRLVSCAGQSYSKRLTNLGMCTLELRRLHADLVFCFTILHGMIKLNIDNVFVLELFNLTRGHCWKLLAVKPRLNPRLHFFPTGQ